MAADSVEADSTRMGRSVGALGAVFRRSLGPLIAFFSVFRAAREIGQTADELDRLGKTAANLNIGVGDLAGLQFGAEREGVAIEKVNAALFTLQKRTGEAAQGIGAAKVAFEQLGISAREFSELDTIDQFKLLADRLSVVSNESERAALTSALFSKEAGREVGKLLKRGSAAIADYVDEATALRDVTEQATEQAAKFNDINTNLGRELRGLVDKAINPLIDGYVRLGESVGLASEKTPELTVQLARARAELETLQRTVAATDAVDFDLIQTRDLRGAAERTREAQAALQKQARLVEDLERQLLEQTSAQREAAKAADELAAERTTAEQAEQRYRSNLEATTAAIENQTSSAKRALDQQTAELRAARAEQESIEQEFARLRDDVTAPDAADVTGLDVQIKALEARRRLQQGDAAGAIDAARAGSDLLRDLSSQGEEAGFTLGFLADQLAKVAREASAEKTETEILDVAREAEKFNVLTEKLERIKGEAAEQGTEIGRAVVANINAELRAADFGEVISSGIRDVARQLEKEGST